MSVILVDRVKAVVFHNGILRVDCVSNGPDGIERESGTLLIPANQAGTVLPALVNATAELDKRLRERAESEQRAAEATEPGPEPAAKAPAEA